jgi:hypothetical protein
MLTTGKDHQNAAVKDAGPIMLKAIKGSKAAQTNMDGDMDEL